MHLVCCSKDAAEAIFSSACFTMVFPSSNVILCRPCGSFTQSFLNLSASSFPGMLQCDGIHWMTVRSVDCCSVVSDETSVSVSVFLGFCSACKTMTTLGCVASLSSRSNLAAWLLFEVFWFYWSMFWAQRKFVSCNDACCQLWCNLHIDFACPTVLELCCLVIAVGLM